MQSLATASCYPSVSGNAREVGLLIKVAITLAVLYHVLRPMHNFPDARS